MKHADHHGKGKALIQCGMCAATASQFKHADSRLTNSIA